MKRIFAVLLIFAIILAIFPQVMFIAFAVENSGICGEVTWTFTEDGKLTFSGNGDMADYSSATYTLTPWFSYASEIKSVEFESGVKHIGDYAFYNYNNKCYPRLESVKTYGAESIGSHAFKYCSAITQVDLGDELDVIAPNAFAYCSALTSISFPAGLTEIGYEAFNYCKALQEIVLPDGITTIDFSAFGNCEALTDATIPESVVTIGTHIFNNCKNETVHTYTNSVAYMYCLLGNLKFDSIGVVETAPVYDSGSDGAYTWTFNSDGTLEIMGNGAMPDYTATSYYDAPWFIYSRQVTKVIIGEGITHVGDNTFLNTSNVFYPNLQSVEILGNASIGEAAFKYSNLTSAVFSGETDVIGKDAFAYCSSLTSLTLHDGLEEIGYAAFRNCSALSQIILPDSVQTIEDCAFWGCESLIDMTIPASVTSMGTSCFKYCNAKLCGYTNSWAYMFSLLNNLKLESIGTLETPAVYDSGMSGDVVWTFYADGTITLTGEGSMDDYSSVDAPWKNYRSQILKIEIFEEITGVGDYAFADCRKITDVYFYGDAPQIADNAFNKVTANAHYHYSCNGWTENVMVNYGGKLTWISLECIHEYEITVTAPTCTADGYTTYTCKYCGESYTDGIVSAAGHSYVGEVTPPTCTENGFTTFSCGICNDIFIGEYVDVLGHDYTLDIKAPTCTKEGIAVYTCKRCDNTYSEVMSSVACPTKEYIDVPNASNWGHAGIDFCVDRGIMGSTSATSLVFDPDTVCTRAMIVTILYRLSESPETRYENAFPDVPDGQWYSIPVIWAYQNDVVNGFETGEFRPGDQITREQMAAILMRYAQNVAHKDTSDAANLDAFADVADVTWSKPYFQWAVAVEMILGTSRIDGKTILDPQGKATRVQAASLVMRFIQNIVEQ